MTATDVHSHVIPAPFPVVPGDDRGWGAETVEDATVLRAAGRPPRRLPADVVDLKLRAANLVARGITRQYLSPLPDLMPSELPAAVAAAFCEEVNAALAAAVAGSGFFRGIGIVPMQDVDTACRQLQVVHDLGLRGVELSTNIDAVPLGDPRFVPFFEELARLELFGLIHSSGSRYRAEVPTGGPGVALLTGGDVGLAMGMLLTNGVAGIPGIRLCFTHGGGSGPLTAIRLQYHWEQGLLPKVETAPCELLRAFTFDSLVFSPDALGALVDQVGPEAVVLGTDHPAFPTYVGLEVIEDAQIPEKVRERILVANVARLDSRA